MADSDIVYIVIPAFNEAKMIGGVIQSIKRAGFNNIIVVDDGSTDSTFDTSKKNGAKVYRHLVNRGKGAATQTGLDAAKLLKADFAVTMDADGQHFAEDIKKLLEPLIKGKCDVALGSRMLGKGNMPISKKVTNWIGNLITYIFYGIYVTDSQSGMRGYNKKALELIQTKFDRFEFESEVLQQIKANDLNYTEFPISVEYSDYSKNKYNHITGFEANKIFNGFKMVFRMAIRSISL